jgi:hypothetical protein
VCKEKHELFKKAMYEYNINPNDEKRMNVYIKKKDYKYYCRKCKNNYNKTFAQSLNTIKHKSPREFWKTFKQKSPGNRGEEITVDSFYEHFKNLSTNHDKRETNNDCDDFVKTFLESEGNNATFEELDKPISVEEIVLASKSLGSNKACSADNILYEYFTSCINDIVNPLQLLFNYILDSRSFPKCWSSGIIIPLHKRVIQQTRVIIGELR